LTSCDDGAVVVGKRSGGEAEEVMCV